jgi:hypothetical protein
VKLSNLDIRAAKGLNRELSVLVRNFVTEEALETAHIIG